MSDFIQLPDDGTGKKVETYKPDGTKHRQAFVLGDGTTTDTLTIGADGAEVDVKTLPPGASTSAKQDEAQTALDLIDASLLSIDGKIPALGQAAAGASTPVVLPAAQITALTPPAAITGFATEVTLAAGNVLDGAVNEAAPTTDTASSGLNGRLQRIAQRLTSLITTMGSPFQAGGALGSGSAVIGHVIVDTTSTTAVTQATAANLNAAVVGTGTAGTAAGGVLTVQGAASMTKLLVTPDSVALPANQSVNVAQINAVTPLMGAGNTGTGSPRVTIASDQASIPVAATLQANSGVDIGKLTANQSVNVAQINAVTPLMGAGNTGTGSPRVTIASDQASIPVAATLQSNTGVDIGKLTANQSVNVSQINAVTPLMGAGNTGTGSVRVTIATDQAQLTNKLLVTPDANSAVNVAQMNGVATTMGAGAVGTGVQRVTLGSDDPAVATLGATTGAAVITDANGTIQQYLRGLIKLAITAGSFLVTVSSLPTVTRKNSYVASAALTITIASTGTSAGLTAGTESDLVDNTTNKYTDAYITAVVMTGSSPTGGYIQLWVVPIFTDSAWPDVFDGTSSAETVTSANILGACAVLGASVGVSTSSNVAYPLRTPSLAQMFGFPPKKIVVFITHSTGVNLNSTGGNHNVTINWNSETQS